MYVLNTKQGVIGFNECVRKDQENHHYLLLGGNEEGLVVLVRLLTSEEIRMDKYLEERCYFFDAAAQEEERSNLGRPGIAVKKFENMEQGRNYINRIASGEGAGA